MNVFIPKYWHVFHIIALNVIARSKIIGMLLMTETKLIFIQEQFWEYIIYSFLSLKMT